MPLALISCRVYLYCFAEALFTPYVVLLMADLRWLRRLLSAFDRRFIASLLLQRGTYFPRRYAF